MHRVELKVGRSTSSALAIKSFLMHRVELKGLFFGAGAGRERTFLMHRVELKGCGSGKMRSTTEVRS